jgi:hypothetical protein
MIRSAILCGCALTALITLVEPPAASAAGAIALGRCTRIGWSNNFGSRSGARAEALSRCRENGDGSCKVVVTVRGLCGAVAISGNCEARGWAYAGSRGEAEQLALNECSSRGGRGCTIHRWVCDGR